jgi:hypothetical protein
VLTNQINSKVLAGTLVSDVSDHFFTFIIPMSSTKCNQQAHKTIDSRDFSLHNLATKLEMSMANWESVLSMTDVDSVYDEFWKIYTEIFNRIFVLKRRRFDKNINKRQNFITRGILVSRKTKQSLHKNSISSPSVQ